MYKIHVLNFFRKDWIKMFFNDKWKVQKGITLIALVVTIIVLLILAGVSISMLTGENRNIRKDKGSKSRNEKGRI